MKKIYGFKRNLILFNFLVLVFLTICLISCQLQLPKLDFVEGTHEYELEEVRYKYNLPAITVAVKNNDEPPIFCSIGYRNVKDDDNYVTKTDKWHIGSITKSMTATLIAKLIEINPSLSWDLKLIDVFPELDEQINSAYKDVTFVELLSHTAGMMSDLTTLNDWDSYFTDESSLTQQRYRLIKEILKKQPEVSKGTYLYSNAGYIVAAAMIEEITKKSWEELISTNIFQPLDMNYTGFGPPKPALEEPQGHTQSGLCSSWQPANPDNIYSDNPEVLGPAGTVHTTLSDILKYAQVHLNGLKRIGIFLSQSSFDRLHQIVSSSYALGWTVGNNTIYHYGSNTKWFAILYIYYDPISTHSCIVFAAYNACFSDFSYNYDIMDEILSVAWNF